MSKISIRCTAIPQNYLNIEMATYHYLHSLGKIQVDNLKIYMQCMRNPSARGQGHDLEDEGQGHR